MHSSKHKSHKSPIGWNGEISSLHSFNFPLSCSSLSSLKAILVLIKESSRVTATKGQCMQKRRKAGAKDRKRCENAPIGLNKRHAEDLCQSRGAIPHSLGVPHSKRAPFRLFPKLQRSSLDHKQQQQPLTTSETLLVVSPSTSNCWLLVLHWRLSQVGATSAVPWIPVP